MSRGSFILKQVWIRISIRYCEYGSILLIILNTHCWSLIDQYTTNKLPFVLRGGSNFSFIVCCMNQIVVIEFYHYFWGYHRRGHFLLCKLICILISANLKKSQLNSMLFSIFWKIFWLLWVDIGSHCVQYRDFLAPNISFIRWLWKRRNYESIASS